MTFGPRGQFIQTKREIASYLEQFLNYNTTIQNNFSGMAGLDVPWSKIECRIEYKRNAKKIEYQFSKDDLTLLELEADFEKKEITSKPRPSEVKLTHPEWEFYLSTFKKFVNRLPF